MIVFYEDKKLFLILKAINLLKMLFDKKLKLLDKAKLAFWKKKTLVSNCQLWDTMNRINKSYI